MGNCGFTLAPCAKADRHLVVRNLQRAEDISREAMEAGIEWTWTTFPEFLDTLEALPKGINYAGYIGHSALRTYVMGERAFDEPATEDDLRAMERELRDALAPAPSASRPRARRATRRPTGGRWRAASRPGTRCGGWSASMGDMNAGIFEIAGEGVDREVGRPGPARLPRAAARLAVETGRPDHVRASSAAQGRARHLAPLPRRCSTRPPRAGGRMFAQVHSRALTVVLSFKTQLPFDRLPVWKELRALPLDEQKHAPARSRAAPPAGRGRARARRPRRIGTEARPAAYDWIFVMDTVRGRRTARWPRSRASAASTRSRP